jgi:hypothetical protein
VPFGTLDSAGRDSGATNAAACVVEADVSKHVETRGSARQGASPKQKRSEATNICI